MKVCKFGGSSVADAAQMLKVLGIVKSDPRRRVVVVSAPGKRRKGDDKVTDLLIACAADALAGRDPAENVARVVARYESLRADLGLDEGLVAGVRSELLRRLAGPRDHEGAFLDAVKALGEEESARFCAAAFTARGLRSVYVDPREAGMILSDEFGAAQLLPESYARIRAKLAPIPEVVVFPGFYGYTRSGRLATFSRGGSDITGAILAAALGADVYENFTDVDAVYPVDPRLCPEAAGGEGIREMTYAEMRELSYAGFASLQRPVEPLHLVAGGRHGPFALAHALDLLGHILRRAEILRREEVPFLVWIRVQIPQPGKHHRLARAFNANYRDFFHVKFLSFRTEDEGRKTKDGGSRR